MVGGSSKYFSQSVQSFSHVQLFPYQASLSITNSWSLLKLMSIKSVSPPAFSLSQASGSSQMSQFFASGGQSIVVSASTSVLPMNTQDCFHYVGFPCSPRTLESLLQHHNLKASILQCSAFFMVQVSHLYMITGITLAT